jgi:hypothetical protein
MSGPKSGFDAQITGPNQSSDRIGRKDISALFRMDYHERVASWPLQIIFFRPHEKPFQRRRNRIRVCYFLGCEVMEALIPGVFIRDSNRHTSTAAQRPDFGFLYLNICPFSGEASFRVLR